MSSHSHHHDHDHGRPAGLETRQRKLRLALGLTSAIVILEAVGGWISGSLALLSDAGHMAVDALALVLALVGAWYTQRPADARRSYGYGRMEVLAGFVNAQIQVVLSLIIVLEAIRRLGHLGGVEIHTGVMFWTALLGLGANIGILRTLHGHAEDDLNSAAAVLHVLGDMLGAAVALVAAALIWSFGWRWADPALSILVALLMAYHAWPLLQRSAHILLEGVPEGLEPRDLMAKMRAADTAIEDIHHLHVWQLASGQRIATLHALVRAEAAHTQVLSALNRVAIDDFGISHLTVQLETAACHPQAQHCRHAG